tara:strand:- start:395 stop:1006 length:612 start_codon:yes stop_codon:yes gene_type:complete
MSQIKLKHSGGNSVIIAAPDSNPASDRTLKLPSDGDGTILTTNSATGKILQVVQTVKTDVFSQTNVGQGTFTNAILSATITPSSNSSKILIIASLSISISNDNRIGMGIFRGGSIISDATGDANSSNNRVAVSSFLSSTSFQASMNVNFVDSPATTNATTYDIRGTHGRNSSVTFYAGRENTTATSSDRMRSAQFLTLMEVAA